MRPFYAAVRLEPLRAIKQPCSDWKHFPLYASGDIGRASKENSRRIRREIFGIHQGPGGDG